MEPPYYAVIFTSTLKKNEPAYHELSARVLKEAENQPGFLGMDTARSGLGISVSYWKDMESIRAWKQHMGHKAAKAEGKEQWYDWYRIRIAEVRQDWEWSAL